MNALPCSLLFVPASYFERLDLKRVFPVTQPLEVELGSGDGSFLAQWAAARPQHNFLGVERLVGRLRKLNRKGMEMGLGNLRLLRIEAGYCVEYLLPAGSVAALHIYFPDPWPKRKHRPNRLLNERFAICAARALQPSGTLYLRTDDTDYFEQMQRVFDRNSSYRAVETPPTLAAIETDFEREFHARGVPTLRAAYQLDS